MVSIIERDLRLRLQRLLRGERHVDDLCTLFLSQRDKLHTRPTVKEVGDFVAHRDVRVKGDSHRQARGIFIGARGLWAEGPGGVVDTDVLTVSSAASLTVFRDDELQSKLGLSRQSAESMLGRCRAKEFGKRRPLNPKEKLLVTLLREPPTRPVFTPAELIRDLAETLLAGGLLVQADVPQLEAAADFISLFVVAKMHGAELSLDDGFSAHLKAHGGTTPIQVWCGCMMLSPYVPPMGIYVPMFFTDLAAEAHCTPELLAIEDWSMPLELRRDGLLGLVR